MSVCRIKWLATTCPPSGALRDVQYLGAAVLTDKVDGHVIHCAGRFAFLPGGDGPVWLQPFENHFGSEAETRAAYNRMALEWDHSLAYQR